MENYFENLNLAKEAIEKSFADFKFNLKNQENNVEKLIQELIFSRENHRDIFLLGFGRSSDVLNFFSTRLVQSIEYNWGQERLFEKHKVKMVNEDDFEPIIPPNTLVICLTGTGKTSLTLSFAEAYLEMGAKLILVTSNTEGTLWKNEKVELKIYVPGLDETDIAKKSPALEPDTPIRFKDTNPGPTYFEFNSLILFESIISVLKKSVESRH